MGWEGWGFLSIFKLRMGQRVYGREERLVCWQRDSGCCRLDGERGSERTVDLGIEIILKKSSLVVRLSNDLLAATGVEKLFFSPPTCYMYGYTRCFEHANELPNAGNQGLTAP